MRPAPSSLAICHVLTSVHVGGAERVVLDLARTQRALGHRVAVLSLTDLEGALARDFRDAVETLEAMPKRGGGVDPTLPFRLARWFRKHRIDLVHTHNELPLIYGGPGGKLARAAVVHSKHGVVAVRSRAHLLRRAAATAVDLFVAVSEATADVARATQECSARKLRVIVNGTDLSRFPAADGSRDAVRRELRIPAGARVLVTIGRLVPEKNHALLVRAASPLLGPNVRLVIVGDGRLRGELRAQVDRLPGHVRDFVNLTGARRDVPELLAAADAFVMSSDSEGLPIGLIEAWAASRPVAATAVGGIPAAMRDGETGLLVPKGDEDALRAALVRVLAESEEMRRMAERGRAHALAMYSADSMARAYLELYESARDGRSA